MTKEKIEFGVDRKVSVSARAFAAAMLAVSTEETRYYLNGVLVEPNPAGGVNVVATNGHILIAIHDEDGETNGTWICPIPSHLRQFLLANLEPRPDPEEMDGDFYADEPGIVTTHAKRQPDRIKFDGHMASITAPEFAWKENSPIEVVMAAKAQAIDGKFPDWSRVLPRPTDTTPALTDFTLAARYIMEINRAVRIWNDSLATGLRVRAVEKNGPVLFGAYESPAFVSAIMPMRDDAPALRVPEWVKAPEQTAA